jgi:hypothetical protein
MKNDCHPSWQDKDAQQEQSRNANEDKRVPRQADAPEHIAAQQSAYSCFSFGDSRHDERRDRWPSDQGKEQPEMQWEVQEDKEQQSDAPGNRISDEKVKEQRVTPQQAIELSRGLSWGG